MAAGLEMLSPYRLVWFYLVVQIAQKVHKFSPFSQVPCDLSEDLRSRLRMVCNQAFSLTTD